MPYIWSGSIAIVRKGTNDYGNSTGSISFIDNFLDFCGIFIESGSSLYCTIDDISGNAIFSGSVDSITEGTILSWIGSFFCSKCDEFGVEGIYLCFRFGVFFFGSGNNRSASHRGNIINNNEKYTKKIL